MHSIDNGDSISWYNDSNQRHRVDGPAIIWKDDGEQLWYQHGVLHREDGPAIEFADGSKEWYFRGLMHRIGGPALEDIYGNDEWCLNGQCYTDIDEYCAAAGISGKHKTMMLLKYPCAVS